MAHEVRIPVDQRNVDLRVEDLEVFGRGSAADACADDDDFCAGRRCERFGCHPRPGSAGGSARGGKGHGRQKAAAVKHDCISHFCSPVLMFAKKSAMRSISSSP